MQNANGLQWDVAPTEQKNKFYRTQQKPREQKSENHNLGYYKCGWFVGCWAYINFDI
jgi:hypothetical protein